MNSFGCYDHLDVFDIHTTQGLTSEASILSCIYHYCQGCLYNCHLTAGYSNSVVFMLSHVISNL